MKKLIILMLFLTSCTQEVLNRKSYQVIDTLNVSKNGFQYVLGYDVIIKYNGSYYSGYINDNGQLTHLNFKPINICEK